MANVPKPVVGAGDGLLVPITLNSPTVEEAPKAFSESRPSFLPAEGVLTNRIDG